MAKKTLLDIVQDILSDMTSDEVNSISDTTESLQVAQIVRSTYEEIILDSNKKWPHLNKLIQLTPLADPTRPNYMLLPDNVQSITYIGYDKQTSTDTKKKYSEVFRKDKGDFLALVNSRDSSKSNVLTVQDPHENVELFILNDTAPAYWTTFDDTYIIFDAYDSEIESTIQNSKMQVLADIEPTWIMQDTFIPDLPSKYFPYLLSEVKSRCFNVIKQVADVKSEQSSNRQRTHLSWSKWRGKKDDKYPNYGRIDNK